MRAWIPALLIFPLLVVAQQPTWYTVASEPSIRVEGIAKDTLGFLWVHDGQALYRFDGMEAKEMTRFDDDEITSISYASSHTLAVGTSSGRIVLFNPYTFDRKIIYNNGGKYDITGAVVLDSATFIALSYGHGIVIAGQGTTTLYTVEDGLISNEVYEAAPYADRFYIATDQGIQIVNLGSDDTLEAAITADDGLADMVVTHLVHHNDKLWYTDYDRNVGHIDQQGRIKTFRLPDKGKISALTTYANDLYVGTSNGLYLLQQDTFVLKSTENIKLAVVDEESNLWVLIANGELKKGNLYFQSIEVPISDIRSIAVLNDQVLLGNESGIYQLDTDGLVKMTDDNITCMATYGHYVIAGTFSEGVKVYDDHLNQVSNLNSWDQVSNESVLSIYINEDEVYISSLSGVLVTGLDGERLVVKRALNTVIGQAYVYTMLIEGDVMYFGTDRDGLYTLHLTKDQVAPIEKFEDGSKIGSVYAVASDDTGTIWFTSSEAGIGYLDNGVARRLDRVPDVKDEYTSMRVVDGKRLLLVRANAIDLLDIDDEHFMCFDNELGIMEDISYLNIITTCGDTTLFAIGNSIYYYHYDANPKIHPEIIIDRKSVNLSPITDRTDVFNQDQNNFKFDYSGTWLTDPQELTYQYLLEGFDTQWRRTKDKTVSYPQLPANTYTFKVRASENGLFKNAPEASYSFTIHKHFYNLWWVRVILLLALGYLLYLYVKQREARKKEKLTLEKLNIENQFINLRNQLNPHFLFNAFNTLIGLIEEDNERSVLFVEKMSDFYRNMIAYGKSNLIELADEREVLSQYIDILKARFNGQLQIDSRWEDDLSGYRIPPFTLQLLVENAVKHNVVSTKNPLLISIHQAGDRLVVKNYKSALIQPTTGTKTGLQNIKARFELVNIQAPQVREDEAFFEVTIKLAKYESGTT